MLHLVLLLHRLEKDGDAGARGRNPAIGGHGLGQKLFDAFCQDLDDNLREMGVGDQTVPKRMRAFGEAFYGRIRAYDQAIDEGREALASAISRNILNGTELGQARRLAAYVSATDADLSRIDEGTLLRGSFTFPSPLQENVAP